MNSNTDVVTVLLEGLHTGYNQIVAQWWRDIGENTPDIQGEGDRVRLVIPKTKLTKVTRALLDEKRRPAEMYCAVLPPARIGQIPKIIRGESYAHKEEIRSRAGGRKLPLNALPSQIDPKTYPGPQP